VEGDGRESGTYAIVDEDRSVVLPSEFLSPPMQTLGTLVEQLLGNQVRREKKGKGIEPVLVPD
jgi:hypothetical protein